MESNETMIQPVEDRRGEKGVTTVEYALMLGLIALAVALATPALKTAVVTMFNTMANSLNGLSA